MYSTKLKVVNVRYGQVIAIPLYLEDSHIQQLQVQLIFCVLNKFLLFHLFFLQLKKKFVMSKWCISFFVSVQHCIVYAQYILHYTSRCWLDRPIVRIPVQSPSPGEQSSILLLKLVPYIVWVVLIDAHSVWCLHFIAV